MKVLKYTFEIPQFDIDDGELILLEPKKEKHTFTLMFKGMNVYEKLTGRPLLTDMQKFENSSLDINFIRDVACASFCKIDNDKFHQNLSTVEEFKQTEAFNRISSDLEFTNQLLDMVMDCCLNEKQKEEMKKKVAQTTKS